MINLARVPPRRTAPGRPLPSKEPRKQRARQRGRRRSRVRGLPAAVLLVGATILAVNVFSSLHAVGGGGGPEASAAEGGGGGGRRRLAGSNETFAESLQDGCHPLDPWEKEAGGVTLYALIMLYSFFALAIVCDDFFVDSLEQISFDHLGLTDDVAGATFMAAGSSAPELFVSVADNVLNKPGKVIGMGTIIGSAIFNICVIIAVTSILAGKALQLDYRPLGRDSAWYALSISMLLVVSWDTEVDLVESIILFVGYLGYIVHMYFNERYMAFMKEKFGAPIAAAEDVAPLGKDSPSSSDGNGVTPHAPPLQLVTASSKRVISGHDGASSEEVRNPSQRRGSRPDAAAANRWFNSDKSAGKRNSFTGKIDSPKTGNTASAVLDRPHASSFDNPMRTSGQSGASGDEAARAAAATAAAADEAGDDDEEGKTSNYWNTVWWVDEGDKPDSVREMLWFLLVWPIQVAFKLTIPDCRFKVWKNGVGCTLTFIMSIVWIGVLTFVVHYCIVKIGCALNAPFSLLALTVIAAGTSVPDALASVNVAQSGQGDMAVSNAIGSNIFDILLGLGLPFIMSNLIYDAPVRVGSEEEDFGELIISVFILFAVLACVILILKCARWKLQPRVGASLFALYFAYVIFAYVYETAK